MPAVKFYELDTSRRLQMLVDEGLIDERDRATLAPSRALPEDIGSHLIENHIGAFPVPLGLAEHFLIDGRALRVPMATEEPSVIAAAGNAAQRVARSGGFHTRASRRGIVAQIVFRQGDGVGGDASGNRSGGRSGKRGLASFLAAHRREIGDVADRAHPTLRSHGGGLCGIEVRRTGEFVEFDLLIATGEAMGANTVNTIAEAVAAYLSARLAGFDLLMAILSNKADDQRVHVEARIAAADLATSTMPGDEVASRIAAAARFAEQSDLRAATHNKGVMNGIVAAALAAGNDVRNVVAAAYADLDAEQRTWTSWRVADGGLCGSIDMPMPIGVVGGAVSTLPVARLAMTMLGHPGADELMGIIASVGLASNLSAMRALVTQGIQAGHMHLQLRSLAMTTGAQGRELEVLTRRLQADPSRASLERARVSLDAIRAEHASKGEASAGRVHTADGREMIE
ncbi:3-hydroxy-3-methylglutaryl-CoA reductase [Bifidobacterium mongoliense DSM 21395]|uniref:3-hydroxy-3-methylglutaryl-CoA reductase n=1 Tax=Bifidobacterium mongoliense DSM 21395 TaxID=1437603 RepID=A0A087C7B4_9BIFI|nr:3-hydroxy-3-methylglutaryl-CoA reductase [Bifidobacterium mongoliense DSM 21395]